MTRRPAIPAPRGPQPVEARLIGEDTAVRQLVAALQASADCGPASFRSARSGGTRAYLTIVVPPSPDTR